jgi:hypothetical protein
MATAPRRSPVASRPAPEPRSGEERQWRGRGVDLVSMAQDATLRGQGFRRPGRVLRYCDSRTLAVSTTSTMSAPGQDERRAGQLRERITPRWEHSVSADSQGTRHEQRNRELPHRHLPRHKPGNRLTTRHWVIATLRNTSIGFHRLNGDVDHRPCDQTRQPPSSRPHHRRDQRLPKNAMTLWFPASARTGCEIPVRSRLDGRRTDD